jgi:ElaB/YqjD/DUF883 family membrane-anchored ribosome-binding protein
MSTDYTGAEGAGGDSLAAQTQEKVQQGAQQATETAARYVRTQTEARSQQTAQELQNVVDALRRSSHALHAEGNVTAARGVEQVTDRLERLGGYLGGTQGDQMLRDLEAFGRRKPWGMIGIGVGLGVAASRFLKASSSRRYDGSFGNQSGGSVTPAAARLPVTAPADGAVTGEIQFIPARGA